MRRRIAPRRSSQGPKLKTTALRSDVGSANCSSTPNSIECLYVRNEGAGSYSCQQEEVRLSHASLFRFASSISSLTKVAMCLSGSPGARGAIIV